MRSGVDHRPLSNQHPVPNVTSDVKVIPTHSAVEPTEVTRSSRSTTKPVIPISEV